MERLFRNNIWYNLWPTVVSFACCLYIVVYIIAMYWYVGEKEEKKKQGMEK